MPDLSRRHWQGDDALVHCRKRQFHDGWARGLAFSEHSDRPGAIDCVRGVAAVGAVTAGVLLRTWAVFIFLHRALVLPGLDFWACAVRGRATAHFTRSGLGSHQLFTGSPSA